MNHQCDCQPAPAADKSLFIGKVPADVHARLRVLAADNDTSLEAFCRDVLMRAAGEDTDRAKLDRILAILS